MSNVNTVWVVDSDVAARQVLEAALNRAGIQTEFFDNDTVLESQLFLSYPDVILIDIHTPGFDGLQLLSRLQRRYPDIPVIATTAQSNLNSAVACYECGAFEYLPKPFVIDEAVVLIQRAMTYLHKHRPDGVAESNRTVTEIIGEAPAMQEVFRVIGRLSHSSITVLISGESGTGKELVASALHRHSPRADKPFIALNMAAIPQELLDSELFGHEKGAFTGANQQRLGRFEQADGGTLFLDEIGDMPLETQTRLLRVFADGEFYRVGGNTPIKVDVRIIAATHQNFAKLVQTHKFREDLFHRLNVIRIHLPKLADRREDIPALTRYFLQKVARELNLEAKVLRADTEAYLTTLNWPGNVRQLENTCRWLTVMTPGRELRIADLPQELQLGNSCYGLTAAAGPEWQHSLRHWVYCELNSGRRNMQDVLPIVERIMIETALEHSSGRRGEAAALLGWGRNTLPRKIKQLAVVGL